jgi:hypothetical protein
MESGMPEDLGMASIPAGSSAGKSQPAAKPSRPARQSKAKAALAALPVMTAGIKGFDKNLQCRGFQFTIGETFKHDGEVIACRGGFHAITAHPLAVFDYYAPPDRGSVWSSWAAPSTPTIRSRRRLKSSRSARRSDSPT